MNKQAIRDIAQHAIGRADAYLYIGNTADTYVAAAALYELAYAAYADAASAFLRCDDPASAAEAQRRRDAAAVMRDGARHLASTGTTRKGSNDNDVVEQGDKS